MSQLRIVSTNPGTLHSLGQQLAAATEEALRGQYREFREEIKRDLSSIEAECGGCPTFKEWLEEYRNE